MLATACDYHSLGTLNMLSTRNIDSGVKYQLLAKGVEGKAHGSDHNTLESAVANAVKRYPSGEYMMNVQLFTNGDATRVKVVGDVWGTVPPTDGSMPASATGGVAIQPGDRVAFRQGGVMRTGTIVGTRGEKALVEVVRPNGRKDMREVFFDELTKLAPTK